MTWTRQQRTRYRTPSRLHSEAINDASWPQHGWEQNTPAPSSARDALRLIQHHATHKTWTRDQIAQHAADALSQR